MSFRRRTFPEVLDNLLTAIASGVPAEAHPFPPEGANGPPFRHNLQEPPVAEVVSVHGTRYDTTHLFRKNIDYRLSADGLALEWLPGAELPDLGTLLHVNYRPESAQTILTDIHTGSVVRTLTESVALEIARIYAQLEIVYDSGFIDFATGRSLDNVVALLGVERVTGGRARGEISFTRSPASRGAINIPSGTRITTNDGQVEYETTAAVTLAPGQTNVRVQTRDLEANDPLGADSLTVLPLPIAGIASVTNAAPTAISARNETDAELRTRAKNFLIGSERATLGAIQQAIQKQGITADVQELSATPGFVEITPHAESMAPELRQRLLTAIEEVRPAGVRVDLQDVVAPKKINLELRLTTASGLLEQDLRAAQQTVREMVSDYFERLPVREAGSVNRLVGLILSVPGVEDVRVLSATWDGDPADVLERDTGRLAISGAPTILGELHIADPNLPTLLTVLVTYPENAAPPDTAAIQNAMTQAVTNLNALNATELPSDATPEEMEANQATRTLSYDRLLPSVPLPVEPPAGTYHVQFIITIESGLSRILSQPSDEAFVLTPFERLSLGEVELHSEASDD